jgi:hypothetical protein
MRGGILLLLLVTASGCSRSPAQNDPDNSILPPGGKAVVGGEDMVLMVKTKDPGTFYAYLEPGVLVTVERDPGEYREEPVVRIGKKAAQAKKGGKTGEGKPEAAPKQVLKTFKYPEKGAREREIEVTVESGPLKGKAGTVRRFQLRPVK